MWMLLQMHEMYEKVFFDTLLNDHIDQSMPDPVSPLEYIIVPPNLLLNECHNLNMVLSNI